MVGKIHHSSLNFAVLRASQAQPVKQPIEPTPVLAPVDHRKNPEETASPRPATEPIAPDKVADQRIRSALNAYIDQANGATGAAPSRIDEFI